MGLELFYSIIIILELFLSLEIGLRCHGKWVELRQNRFVYNFKFVHNHLQTVNMIIFVQILE